MIQKYTSKKKQSRILNDNADSSRQVSIVDALKSHKKYNFYNQDGNNGIENAVLQGKFAIEEYNDHDYIDLETAKEGIREKIPQIIEVLKSYGIYEDEDNIINYLGVLVESDTLIPPYGDLVTYDSIQFNEEIPVKAHSLDEDEYIVEGVETVDTEECVAFFQSFEDLAEYLIAYATKEFFRNKRLAEESLQQSSTAEDSNSKDFLYQNKDQLSYFSGAYARFPTIYSYGLYKGGNKVDANKQGPHTLAHISVDYLMNVAPTEYNFENQIPNPDEVFQILVNLGVIKDSMVDGDSKLEQYLYSYYNKYNSLEEEIQKGKMLYRELMEMHPMATYAWRGNINKHIAANGTPASRRATAGEGERYGQTLSLDNGWKGVGNTPDNIVEEMKNYLALRLSMAVKEDKLENIIDNLIINGTYTINPYEDLISVPAEY